MSCNYKKTYGMNLASMVKRYGGTYQRFQSLRKNGRLNAFLNNPDNWKGNGKGRKCQTSKYLRLYGMRLVDIVEKYGSSEDRIMRLHKKGLLDHAMKNPQSLAFKNQSKYVLKYAITRNGLAESLGIRPDEVTYLHKLGMLDAFITKQTENQSLITQQT